MLCVSNPEAFKVPGSSKYRIDDGALGILCAYEKNIL